MKHKIYFLLFSFLIVITQCENEEDEPSSMSNIHQFVEGGSDYDRVGINATDSGGGIGNPGIKDDEGHNIKDDEGHNIKDDATDANKSSDSVDDKGSGNGDGHDDGDGDGHGDGKSDGDGVGDGGGHGDSDGDSDNDGDGDGVGDVKTLNNIVNGSNPGALNELNAQVKKVESKNNANCWVNLNAKQHFEVMDAIDNKYETVRKDFQKALKDKHLDKQMLDMMLETKGAAERAKLKAGAASAIPAGISLGGYCMLKMPSSLLFFHRMKLRNETRFRVNYLQNDIVSMALIARLSLHDLHLFGSYERAVIDKNPGTLFYRPTYGEAELLLKDVTYKMEGRYRLVQNRLVIEHVLSDIRLTDVLMMYRINGSANCQTAEQLDPSVIDDFVARLRADLDSWLRDYFNDYLLFFKLTGEEANEELQKYDKEKAMALNDYTDKAIKKLKNRLYSLNPSAASVQIPSFNIFSISGIQINLYNGVIRGMDSFYRQSVATGRRVNDLRSVNAILGFSRIKLEYKYMALISSKIPPLKGLIVLTADELIWNMGITMVRDPESVDLLFNYIRQERPQSLVIEGPLNRMINNFRHLLEDQIISLMVNMLYYHVKMLGSLTRCEPSLIGYLDPGEDKAGGDIERLVHKGPDYALTRNDSIELILPAEGDTPAKKVHVKYDENFQLSETELTNGAEGKSDTGTEDDTDSDTPALRRSKHRSKKKRRNKKKKSQKRSKKSKKKRKHH